MDSSDVASTPDCEIQPSMRTIHDLHNAHSTIQSLTVPELMMRLTDRYRGSAQGSGRDATTRSTPREARSTLDCDDFERRGEAEAYLALEVWGIPDSYA
jgi:hypothetical protein